MNKFENIQINEIGFGYEESNCTIDLYISEDLSANGYYDRLSTIFKGLKFSTKINDDIPIQHPISKNLLRFKDLKEILKQSKRIAVLNAHSTKAPWRYVDVKDGNPNFYPINDWIEERDEENYDFLIIATCNTDDAEPIIKNIPIIYPKGTFGLLSAAIPQLIYPQARN